MVKSRIKKSFRNKRSFSLRFFFSLFLLGVGLLAIFSSLLTLAKIQTYKTKAQNIPPCTQCQNGTCIWQAWFDNVDSNHQIIPSKEKQCYDVGVNPDISKGECLTSTDCNQTTVNNPSENNQNETCYSQDLGRWMTNGEYACDPTVTNFLLLCETSKISITRCLNGCTDKHCNGVTEGAWCRVEGELLGKGGVRCSINGKTLLSCEEPNVECPNGCFADQCTIGNDNIPIPKNPLLNTAPDGPITDCIAANSLGKSDQPCCVKDDIWAITDESTKLGKCYSRAEFNKNNLVPEKQTTCTETGKKRIQTDTSCCDQNTFYSENDMTCLLAKDKIDNKLPALQNGDTSNISGRHVVIDFGAWSIPVQFIQSLMKDPVDLTVWSKKPPEYTEDITSKFKEKASPKICATRYGGFAGIIECINPLSVDYVEVWPAKVSVTVTITYDAKFKSDGGIPLLFCLMGERIWPTYCPPIFGS